jgi:pyridoxamine 5'-phosphate oxidase
MLPGGPDEVISPTVRRVNREHGVVDPIARRAYVGAGLEEEIVASLPTTPPLQVLEQWYADAVADPRVVDPAAMVLATVDAGGRPDARTLLLKALDARGLAFYTNLRSAKGRQLAANPWAALVLPWHPMYRQVRVRGRVEQVPEAEAADYYASRPRDSQIAAWASRQSAPIGSRADLEALVAEQQGRWADVEQVPLPPFWGGYRVRPPEVELWVGHPSRLHDRVAGLSTDGEPARLDDAGAWRVERRQP